MEKIEISMEDYRAFVSSIDRMNEQDLIKAHTALINKTCKNNYREIKDCGVKFIESFLERDDGRSIVYEYSDGAIDFIYSKYLSDYFKNSIKEFLKDDEQSESLYNALNGDKHINDMNEEEIKAIHLSIEEHYKIIIEKNIIITPNITPYFLVYLFKLDGKGVTSYIKNNIDKLYFVNDILSRSGLCNRASFYSGRGVNYGDLSDKNLTEIFKKLIKYDINYGLNFVNMVMNMETLGATEFINSFKNLAENNFQYEKQNIEKSNISLDGLQDESRDAVAFISILEAMNNKNKGFEIQATEMMKKIFISSINPILEEISPEFYEQINSQYYGGYAKTKRYWMGYEML